MSKTQKILGLLKTDLFFFYLVGLIIVFLFIILSPRVCNSIFPSQSKNVLNKFLTSAKTTNKIDPKSYWEFREFYSPGSFTFSSKELQNKLVTQALRTIGLNPALNSSDLIFLFFSSPKLTSLDILTSEDNLSNLLDQENIEKKNIISIGQDYLIYKNGNDKINIAFILSEKDMKKVNGFFDYSEKDKNLIKGRNWLNITSLKTN